MNRLLLLLVVASCGSETISDGICGNGIVDPFEDCDADNDRCVGCSITCTSDQECLDYDPGTTDGFVCGPDGFCHAPAGTFELGNQFSMQVTDYRISDLDRDGTGDLLVQSQTSVSAVIGSADPATTDSSSIQTPIAFGSAGFFDIDGDGALDTMLPTADGVAAFTSSFGTPAPYPFPSTLGAGMGIPRFVNPLAPTHMLFVGTDPAQQKILMIAMDVAQPTPTPIGQSFICNDAPFEELVPNDIDVVESSPGHQIYALTLHPAAGPLKVCLVMVDFNGVGYDITPVAFTPQQAPRARAVLAPLDGAACPSLVVSEGAGILMEYPPTSLDAPCGFSAPTAIPGIPPGSAPVGFVPLDPPIAEARPGALAVSTGIFKLPNIGAAVEIYHSDRTLEKLRFVDIDLDGDLDAVASAVNADDLDILDRRIGGVDALTDGFLRFRFDTTAPVTNFLIGDYDGNQVPDVAYIERSVEAGVTVERLNIAFGTFDQLLAGVTVGAFSRVDTLIPAQFFDSTDPFGVISDLVVLGKARAEDVDFVLSLLHGSPQRAMLAFFDPRPTEPPPIGSTFRGVVVGRFSDNPLGNDVLAVEQIATTATTNFYLSRGTAGGAQEFSGEPGNADDAAMCATGAVNGKLCIDQAIYTTWTLGAGDRVVAVDNSLMVASFDPSELQPTNPGDPVPPLVITQWPDRLAGTGIPREIRQVVFGDGTERLLISLAAPPGDDTRMKGAVDLCTFDPDPAIGPQCVDVGAKIAELSGAPVVCVDAAIGKVAPASRFSAPSTTGPDLLVVCHHPKQVGVPEAPPIPDAVYRVAVEGGEIRSATPLFMDLLTDSVSIQIGDVSGDGIDDIVVLDRGGAVPQFRVFRQCTSRDSQCGTVAVVGPAVGAP